MSQNIITEKGLTKPTLNDCVQQIGDALESELGNVNREADSVTGQWIGVEAEANAVHFEALEFLWSSRFISTATGYALDAIGQWIGVARRAKSYSRINAVIIGSESVTVPAGSLAGFANYQFSLDTDSVITRSDLVTGAFRVNDASQPEYTVRVNGKDHSYRKKVTDTLIDIANGIADVINQDGTFTALANGSAVNVAAVNLVQGYPVSLSAGLDWVSIGSPARFTSKASGAIVVPVGGLKTPISAVSGWTGVNNLLPGSTGSERELDNDYRTRLLNSRSNASAAATVSAIESRILAEVDGVTLVHVIENKTMQTINNMPAKSIQVVVSGGVEQDIANAIWKYKGAGIETYGDIRLTAFDRHGKAHDVQFSRPGEVSLYVRVVVNLLDNEESLTSNVIVAIKEGVAQYIETLALGDDVITQRIYGYIYANSSGIGKMTVSISTDGIDFTESNLSVAENERVILNQNNIEVSGV